MQLHHFQEEIELALPVLLINAVRNTGCDVPLLTLNATKTENGLFLISDHNTRQFQDIVYQRCFPLIPMTTTIHLDVSV